MTFSSMPRMLAFGFAFAFASQAPAYSATSTISDSNLYTVYQLSGDTAINWTTCGRTGNSSGCYGSGSLGPLAGPCAIMETGETITGNTISRYVYIVEASSTGFKNAVLDVYLKQDVLTGGSDIPSISLVHRIDLGLAVGLKTACFMAGGPRYLFIATALSVRAMRYDKFTGKVVPESESSSPAAPVTAITADERGYVTVSHSSARAPAFDVYDPNGDNTDTGGGTNFMLNASVGTKPQ